MQWVFMMLKSITAQVLLRQTFKVATADTILIYAAPTAAAVTAAHSF
jgi:hypothetical protein